MDDQQLLAAIQRDPEAFRILYRKYFPRVYAYIAYRVGHVQDTEDLTAETFLQVVTSIRSFQYRGEGALAAWIFRIAYHRVVDHYRAQRDDRLIALEDLAELSADGLTPEGMIEQRERFAALHWLSQILSLNTNRSLFI